MPLSATSGLDTSPITQGPAPRLHRVAVCQTNYVPWKGYFDLIRAVDTFVLYDVAQFTKNDWRNRNQIKTPQGLQWLTIPVQHGRLEKTVLETQVASGRWANKHWQSIAHSYRKAPYFERYADELKALYQSLADERSLSVINRRFLRHLCQVLALPARILHAEDFALPEGRNKRLVALLDQLHTSHYLTGPAARGYLDRDLFRSHGISVHWANYESYPEYPQLHGPFSHHVSVLDLLFNTGPSATTFMKPQLPKRTLTVAAEVPWEVRPEVLLTGS